MNFRAMPSRRVALVVVISVLAALLAYVALRSGPLAPVAATVTTVESAAPKPALFGIGTIEARHLVSIGPVLPGRLGGITVDVGDHVDAGQIVGTMDPVDLDDRLRAQDAAVSRVQASVREASARRELAASQLQRQEKLYAARMVSEETLVARRQELAVADAALGAMREELARVRSEAAAMNAQRGNLDLTAPIAGIVIRRDAEPGSTLMAGQSVIDIVDPQSLWINVRIDQSSATGLAADLPAGIALRSRNGSILADRVLRVEPTADTVTEEVLAKVVFDQRPEPLVDAYLSGLEDGVNAKQSIDHIASVASFFVSRVDTKVDPQLPEGSPLKGKAALANAKLAYDEYHKTFAGSRWEKLKYKGARVQRPLWASTSTKNPAYLDTYYVDNLIGPETVNTIPTATLNAFKDHGTAALTLMRGVDEAQNDIAQLEARGISMDVVTIELEDEGVKAFDEGITLLGWACVRLRVKPGVTKAVRLALVQGSSVVWLVGGSCAWQWAQGQAMMPKAMALSTRPTRVCTPVLA